MSFLGWFFENKTDVRLKLMFSQMAGLIVSCADELRRFFDEIENGEAIMQRIVELEHQGDNLTQAVHQLLDRTFIISWLDKEDATSLADHLDSFLDAIRGVARYARLYGLTEVRPHAKEITQSICKVADGVQSLMIAFIRKDFASVTKHHDTISQLERKVDDLRDFAISQLWQKTENDCRQFISLMIAFIRKDFASVTKHHDTISQPEGKVDDLCDSAICQLWQEIENGWRQFVSWRDVFEGLEKVADRGHHIARTILSLARKSQ